MKGFDNSKVTSTGMTNKPIVTCCGDWNLFCTLEAPLVAAIPQDSCEWRRSYGRVTKSVTLEANFVKFNKDKLQSDVSWNLLKRPVFHIYWTDCADVEYYKTTLREDIETWLKELESKAITDFMVVLVETYDIRKTNKLLPRTTVLDKIKADFAVKQTEDRFISVINPIKSESRSAESWRTLVAKIRNLILVSYNKSLIKFEDYMREQREKRNDPEWDFCKYFILQEQLAFVLEMLSLYEESLVQYDELDALFSQFVLNSNVTESPKWLDNFRQPISAWQAVRLTVLVPQHLRELIMKKKATLLDFRSYLFQRQCAMLLLTYRPWEISSRCLTTVHNTMKELELLSISLPEGAANCWALLACTETLNACESLQSSDSNALELCTAQQAPLLDYAKDKLHSLGKLCGLLPGSPDPSSEQLHFVVMLSAGMGDNGVNQKPTPTDRLKEALCSKHSFQQYYLELAELAMGTYKHIGRLRFARLIGRDLAAFYSELGETSKAMVFLMDALRSYEEQGWKELAAQTRLELVACANKMNDAQRYTKLSATIASTPELEILVRNFYFDEMIKSIKTKLRDQSETVLTELTDCFKIESVALIPPERGVYITDNKIECRLTVESFLPKEVHCSASVCIQHCRNNEKNERRTPIKNAKTDLVSNSLSVQSPKKVQDSNENENINFVSSVNLDDLKPKNPLLHPMNFTSQLHYKEDKTLQKVTVECVNPKMAVKRSDSSKYRKPSSTVRNDFSTSFKSEQFVLKPGKNEFLLEYTPKTPGAYMLGQVSLIVEEKLEFLSNVLSNAKVGFEVLTQGVNVYLNKVEPKKDLVAGLEHDMELVVTSGSTSIEESAKVVLKTSTGLLIGEASTGRELGRELTVSVPACKPFDTIKVPLKLFANIQTKNKDKNIEHTVWLTCPWWDTATEVPLHFTPPVVVSWRLLTSNTRKFIHVTLKSTVAHLLKFVLTEPKLESDTSDTISDLNPKKCGDLLVCSDGTTASFMWELLKDPLVKGSPIKATFSVRYKLLESEEPARLYACPFDIQDYTTLFVIRTRLEQCKGSDFCRATQMCYLQLSIQRVNETEFTSLMYEVLADQSMWAVLGRTAGVISLESGSECQSVRLEVLPLVAGFLPLPSVRLSKYIAANSKDPKRDISAHPRLEPFSSGQVYHAGKAMQVHILAPLPKDNLEPPI